MSTNRFDVIGTIPNINDKVVTDEGYFTEAYREYLEDVHQALFFEGSDVISDVSVVSHTELTDIGTNTHAQIDTHIADAGKHREINDSGTATTDLWSASKIDTELATKLEEDTATVEASGDWQFNNYVLLDTGIEYNLGSPAVAMQFMRNDGSGTNRVTISTIDHMVFKDTSGTEQIRLTSDAIQMRNLFTSRGGAGAANNELWNDGGTLKINQGTLFSLDELTVTYTSNDPSITPNQSITIADGSAPTVSELLEFCVELNDRISAIKGQIDG